MELIDIPYERYENSLSLDDVEIESGITISDYNIVKAAQIIKDNNHYFDGNADELIVDLLSNRQFAQAPASTAPYRHGCFYGGLLAHSLNVYDTYQKYARRTHSLGLYAAAGIPDLDSGANLNPSLHYDVEAASTFAAKYATKEEIRSLYKGVDKNWEREKDLIFQQVKERNEKWGYDFGQLHHYWRDALNDVDAGNVSIDDAITILRTMEENGEEGYIPLTKADEIKMRSIAKARKKWEASFKMTMNGRRVIEKLGEQELRLERVEEDGTAQQIYDGVYEDKKIYFDKLRALDPLTQGVYALVDRFSILDSGNVLHLMKQTEEGVVRSDIDDSITKLKKAGLITSYSIKPSDIKDKYAVASILHDVCKSAAHIDGKYIPYYLPNADENGYISEKKPFKINAELKNNENMYDYLRREWDGNMNKNFLAMKHGALSVLILKDIAGDSLQPLEPSIDYHMGPFDSRWNKEKRENLLSANPEAIVTYQSDLTAARSLDKQMDNALKKGDYDYLVNRVKQDDEYDSVMEILHRIKKDGKRITPEELLSYL